jgi:hypothetical protein
MSSLLDIERLLAENDISASYLSATAENPMAQLFIELFPEEDNSLTTQICHIPLPDSEVFILQCYIQLPLPAPFEPDAEIPPFLISDLQTYIANLNQIIPLVGFNCSQQKMYFRSSLVLEQYSAEQLIYTLELLRYLIESCLPSLQSVAIGLEDVESAIARIPKLFAIERNDRT